MMKTKIFAAALLSVLALSSCSQEKHPAAGVYAIDKYWSESYTGPLGIQVSGGLMTLAGEPLYVTGVNCYNLFIQAVSGNAVTVTEMERTVEVLKNQEVPVVRFSCSPYYPGQMGLYMDHRKDYMDCLEYLAKLCDEAGILIIPSFYWQIACMPEYYGESIDKWGDTSSSTYRFMLAYTKEIVDVLKGHKCLAAWEFGNEFNLAADIAIAGYPDIPASAIGTALKGFSEVVSQNDPEGRLIASGHSVMRNAQWHLANERNWNTDSFNQYKAITAVMTPPLVQGMSEHIYEAARSFSDRGTLDRDGQLKCSMEAAKELGKVFYAGEFTGTADGNDELVSSYYASFYRTGVQLSLIWNYALLGDIEHSFKAGTHAGNVAFSQMRKLNGRFRSDAISNRNNN